MDRRHEKEKREHKGGGQTRKVVIRYLNEIGFNLGKTIRSFTTVIPLV